MHIKNNIGERTAIPHGEALPLFPVDELGASVVQDRDALRQLERLDDEAVLVVGPDGMASGYKLAQHPLTLVELAELSSSRRAALADSTGVSLEEFTHVRIGRTVRSGANRSLSEFEA